MVVKLLNKLDLLLQISQEGFPLMTTLAAHRAALEANHFPIGTPAWIIVNDANLAAIDPPAAMLQKLMHSFYNYGRQHWTWSTAGAAASANGGLVRGNAQNCACSTFNGNLKLLAEQGCGIAGIQSQSHVGHFITLPGGISIDSAWPGNVKLRDQNYGQLKCYKFSSHYWLSLHGVHYDVCFNRTFASVENIIWSQLAQTAPNEAARYHQTPPTLWRLTKPLPTATHLVQVIAQQGIGGWPGFQLVNEQELRMLR